MKIKLLALAITTAASINAVAAPIALPDGPFYLKFDGREQIAATGNTGYGNEVNWGVFTVSTITSGVVTGPNTIETTGSSFFANLQGNGQITGMFYGAERLPSGTGNNAFPATSGFLDLYYRDTSIYGVSELSSALPTVRTSLSTATGFTDGQLLASLAFASGVNDLSDQVFINGSTIPSNGGFAGLATSYANVIIGAGGEWAQAMDTNYFQTLYGARDIRFRNIYESLNSWDNCPDPAENCILGARITDPATGFAVNVVPEPTSVALIGVALVGAGALSRRRKKSA